MCSTCTRKPRASGWMVAPTVNGERVEPAGEILWRTAGFDLPGRRVGQGLHTDRVAGRDGHPRSALGHLGPALFRVRRQSQGDCVADQPPGLARRPGQVPCGYRWLSHGVATTGHPALPPCRAGRSRHRQAGRHLGGGATSRWSNAGHLRHSQWRGRPPARLIPRRTRLGLSSLSYRC